MKDLAQMVSGYGQFHTNEADPANPTKRLVPYSAISLEGIRALVDTPQEVDKPQAQWVIPSALPSRNFTIQRSQGQYWMLWADFDEDPKPISEVRDVMEHVVLGSCNFEIYTSRSATYDRPKSRVLIPLANPLSGADWMLCQEILNVAYASAGLIPDRVSVRPAQLCYLPNRGEYYKSLHQRDEAMFDPLTDWASKIESRRDELAAQAETLEAAKKASQARRKAFQAARAADGGAKSLIETFNEAYCVQDILIQAGYSQRGDKFCRPGSESGSFAASVKDARVHTMSSADPLYTGGGGGGAHDAFGAFCILMHHGNNKDAMADAGDHWLTVGTESWNKVTQREYMRKKATEEARNDTTSSPNINPETGEIESEEELPFGSEQALADAFAIVVADHLKWSPGMEWMSNNGTHWKRDELLTRCNYSQRVCKAAAVGLDNAKLAAKICSASTNNALLSLARSSRGITTPVATWDSYPMLLNTPGGVIDLETGLTVSRGGLLFTQVSGVAPTNMPTPTWDRFISEIFGADQEMVEFIQRMGGYGLTGSIKEQKLFFFHGIGANGKSVLLDVLRNLGGTYSYNLPSEALMTSRNEGHPTMLAALHGKRLAISSEIEESAHWAESRIKSLTGDESLTARYMRQDFFTFNISHKHVIAGNFKPRLKGDDVAMVRRIVLVPFMQRFEGANRDKNLPDKLKQEYPGILRWFVEGARKWAGSGLAIPGAVTEASKEYMDQQNDLELWLSECCKQGPGIIGKCNELYQSFSKWKQRNGEHASSIKSFSQRLERTHKKVRNREGMAFEGVRADDMCTDLGDNQYAKVSKGY